MAGTGTPDRSVDANLEGDVTLNPGDIEIGAVEIKDGDSDTRLDVESDGTKNAAWTQSKTEATTTDAAVDTDANGTISGKLRGLVKLMVNLLSRWPAALGAGGGLKIDGSGTLLPVNLPAKVAVLNEFTRPADATAYAAKDVVCNSTTVPTVLTFANMARATGGSGTIVGARLMTDQKTNVAAFRINLFRTAPTAINDNSPYLMLYANSANRIGSIDIPNLATEDPTNSTGAEGLNIYDRLPFVTSGSASLFAIVETLTAFTPASGQKVTVELTVERD